MRQKGWQGRRGVPSQANTRCLGAWRWQVFWLPWTIRPAFPLSKSSGSGGGVLPDGVAASGSISGGVRLKDAWPLAHRPGLQRRVRSGITPDSLFGSRGEHQPVSHSTRAGKGQDWPDLADFQPTVS